MNIRAIASLAAASVSFGQSSFLIKLLRTIFRSSIASAQSSTGFSFPFHLPPPFYFKKLTDKELCQSTEGLHAVHDLADILHCPSHSGAIANRASLAPLQSYIG